MRVTTQHIFLGEVKDSVINVTAVVTVATALKLAQVFWGAEAFRVDQIEPEVTVIFPSAWEGTTHFWTAYHAAQHAEDAVDFLMLSGCSETEADALRPLCSAVTVTITASLELWQQVSADAQDPEVKALLEGVMFEHERKVLHGER